MSSERLSFRTWQVDDFNRAMSLWGDPQVMTYIEKAALTNEQVKARLETEMACQIKNGVQYWPLYDKADGSFIGCCGLKPWVHSPRGGFEIGFHLLPSAWGKGYAPEAARAVIQWAKAQKFSHLMAGHHPENRNSQAILEKVGFKFLEHVFFPPTGLMHLSYQLPLSE